MGRRFPRFGARHSSRSKMYRNTWKCVQPEPLSKAGNGDGQTAAARDDVWGMDMPQSFIDNKIWNGYTINGM